MNPSERPPLLIESWLRISPEELALVESLKGIDLAGNQELLSYIETKERELDTIQIPQAGKRAREFFDIKKAVLYGLAGEKDYANSLLCDLGRMAQETSDMELEDEIDNALTFLGL